MPFDMRLVTRPECRVPPDQITSVDLAARRDRALLGTWHLGRNPILPGAGHDRLGVREDPPPSAD